MKALVLIIALSCGTHGQEPDRWRGMILGQSKASDAMTAFGQPKSDKLDKVPPLRIKSWLSKDSQKKSFRVLEFKNLEGVDKALLGFQDDKLLFIHLQLKKSIAPGALSNIYNIPFEPMVSAVDVAFNPRDYERNQGKVYPKTFPTVYAMIGVSGDSFVEAMVENVPSFGGALARSMGIPDQPGTLPGKIHRITLVSRTLQTRDGADVLK